MIVQINEFTGDSIHIEEDYIKSSMVKLTLADIDPTQLKTLSTLCSKYKINLQSEDKDFPGKKYLTIPSSTLNNFLKDFRKKGEQYIPDQIIKSLERYKSYNKLPVIINGIKFTDPVIMGILNVTPDSFSDGGLYYDKDSAVEHAIKMIDDGADIVDIGGESTRPGSDPVPDEEEIKRVIPVIEEIINKKPGTIISIDTTKSNVAGKACGAGAKIINDISGLTFDPVIAEVAAEHSAALVVMHIKGRPKDMQANPEYDDLIYEIFEFLYHQTEAAKNKGVQNIIIDPGIGFGKKIENNFEILRRLSDLKNLGYPILIGLSRKSFLSKTLNLDQDETDTFTSVAEALAIRNGAKIIRTHNVVNAVKTRNLLKHFYRT